MDLLKKVLSICFFLITLLWLCKALFLHNYPDFNVFYGGLKAYLSGGNPYLQVEGSVMRFLYPPFCLLFFLPVMLFNREVASVVWVGFSIILLIGSICLLFNLSKRKIVSTEFLVISGLSFLMFPVKFNLGMGQFNNVNLFLICIFLYFFHKKEEIKSGVPLGFSLLLKIFPVLFLPYLLVIRQWRLFVISSTSVVIGMIIGALFLRWSLTEHFVTASLIGTLKSWPLDYYNQALSGFLGRWLGTGEITGSIKIFLNASLIIGTYLVLWLKRDSKKMYILGFASILPLSLATLSFSWQHYFVLVIPTLILLYFHYQKTRASLRNYAVLGLSYILIGANLKNPEAFPVLISSHMLWGTLLLLGLALYAIYRYE